VPLSSADFAMSKIATYGDRGRNIRKLIDYFCQLAVAPHAYADIEENDQEFSQTPYLKAISWLKHDAEDIYDPEYSDVIRIAGLVGFSRGKASSIERTVGARSGYQACGRGTHPLGLRQARSGTSGDRQQVPV
jgi:hypothetical protein